MPSVFWLALLLGYLVGIAAAVMLLPGPMIEPLYGKLAIASAIIVAGIGMLTWVSGHRRAADPEQPASAMAFADEPPVSTTPDEPAAVDADPAGADGAGAGDARPARPDILERLTVVREHGIGASELRRILYEGRVDAFVQPIVSLPQRRLAFHQAVPRLRAEDGRHHTPAEYLSTAARCGLIGLIDQILVVRCAQLIRRELAEGRDICIFCAITPASLNDPTFLAEITAFLTEHGEYARRLVLEIDRLQLDAPSAKTLARLRRMGLRLCLKRLTPQALDPAALAERGFSFVKLEAPRYASHPDQDDLDPELVGLHESLDEAGITLIVDHIDSERTLVEVLDYPVSFGQGQVFAAAGSSAA